MYRGLGTTYQFATSLPLMRSFTVDMPVAAMTEEAMQTVRSDLGAFVKDNIPWIVGAMLGTALVGGVLANWIVPGRRRA
jgi:hypothetical protein